jgi:hypothetical protein
MRGVPLTPAGLSTIQFLGHSEVLQVFVVGTDLYRVPSAFQVMPPLLQASDNSQHLGVVNLVVSLHWVQRLG